MSFFQIKLLAILAMVVDHIGLFFLPNYTFLRIIGRVSFPLFSFLIANGAHYTKNIKNYIIRILIFAFLSQVPYNLAHNSINLENVGLNILFTFFLSLLLIFAVREAKKNTLFIFVLLAVLFFSCILNIDYRFYGVILPLLFYLTFNDKKKMILSFFILAFLASFFSGIEGDRLNFSKVDLGYIFGLFSLAFILSYNHKVGLKAKYLFYVFYPLHFLAIYFIKLFV